MKLGYPRALSYYDYFPFWAGFFSSLGIELVVSALTQREIMADGLKKAPDETCLPVKIMIGHLGAFRAIDGIFLPRLVSMERDTYFCPKILGIPESIRAEVPLGMRVYSVNINWKKGRKDVLKNLRMLIQELGVDSRDVEKALDKALTMQKKYQKLREQGLGFEESMKRFERLKPMEKKSGLAKRVFYFNAPRQAQPEKKQGQPTIALLGHSYLLYESYGNLDLLQLLQQTCNVVLVENITPESVEAQQRTLLKRIFWGHAKKIYGAGASYIEDPEIDGIIYLSCFGCGTDSMTNDLLSRRAKAVKKAFMTITLDEHSGKAGLVTRVEAFLDMLDRRNRHESDIPSYGERLDRSTGLI